MIRAAASRRSFPARVVRDDPLEHGFRERAPNHPASRCPTAGPRRRRGMHPRRTRRDSFLAVPHPILATLLSRLHADQPERLSARHARFHPTHHRGPAPLVWFRSWVRGRAAVLRDSWPRRYWGPVRSGPRGPLARFTPALSPLPDAAVRPAPMDWSGRRSARSRGTLARRRVNQNCTPPLR